MVMVMVVMMMDIVTTWRTTPPMSPAMTCPRSPILSFERLPS